MKEGYYWIRVKWLEQPTIGQYTPRRKRPWKIIGQEESLLEKYITNTYERIERRSNNEQQQLPNIPAIHEMPYMR